MSSPSGPSQLTPQTADPRADSSATFKSMLDAALIKYKEKTGEDLQAIWLASELQTAESADSVIDLLRDQAKSLDRSGDQQLMKWIDPLVHVLSTFSDALGDGVSLAFPPAKVIFTGIGVLLGAAKDARASQGAVIDLFERIESFFKRLEVYNQISLNTKMSEVLVKIVIELLSILSIATKEVKRPLAKLFARKLLGRTDIEDALKRLDILIQEEFQMVTAQILRVATEVKDGVDKTNIAMQQVSTNTEEIKLDVVEVKCEVVEVKHDVEEVKREVEEVKWAQIEQDIQKWFSPPDPSTNYNIGCNAQYKGTTAWFFETKKFLRWMSIGSLLWIHGKPGSGKSVLCSAIIKHVMSLRDDGKASLAYFYFDFRDEDKKQDLSNFVTSLLVQLSAYSTPCCKIIYRLYSTHGKGTQQPSNGALTTCLREMLLVAAQQPIYIIVDALDECPNSDECPESGMSTPRELVLDLLDNLVHQGLPNLRICITSRPEIDIKMALERLPHSSVSLHDEVGQKKDISDYVRGVVHSDKKMWRLRDEEKRLVIDTLTDKADGMFRWVVCQLKVLQDCFPSSLRQTLDQLPKSLDETYVRVLRQISHTNQAHAHRMLQCLMVAVRPLYVEELAELLAFEFDETQGGIPKYRGAWQLDDQTQAVLSTCSSLVTIVGTRYSGQIVQFSHFSVKEFLMSNRLGHLSQYHIHPISAHTILTQACLGFLLHLDDHIPKNSVKNYPLARYAAEHWVKHIQYGDIASRVKEGVETLFDPDRPHFAAWVGIYDIDEARLSKLSMPHFSVPPIRKPNPLYYSVLCGFFDLVKHVALKHPHYVNAMCGGYRFPLFAALEEDRIDIVELLLEHGANVDARGAMGETILLRVLSWPQRNLVNLVNLLLKHEPDVNARDGFFRSSLHLAEYNGELAVAEMLVKQKADVNSQDKYGKTPLLILAKRGKYSEDDVIGHAWSLLEHGADVNIRDKGNEIPLHLAIRNAWFKFASILLEQGADTTAENSEGKTPLHVLSDSQTENEDDVLNHALLLLEHGAEVNIRDKDNETPLHLALRQAWFRFARILLDHGADANAKNNNGISPLHVLAERGICDKGNVGEVLRTLLEYSTEVNRRYDDNGTSSVQEIDASTKKTTGEVSMPKVSQGQYGSQECGIIITELSFERGMDVKVQAENHVAMSQLGSNFDPVQMAEALLESGAKVNARGETSLCQELDGAQIQPQRKKRRKKYLTPLHVASSYGRPDIARVLLDHGATVNAEDSFGRTPLHLVGDGAFNFEQARICLAQLLLERGADVNARDDVNATPLHMASYNARFAIARVLLDCGAYANSKSNQGKTPLHSVAEGTHPYYPKDDDIRVAQLLLERDADVNSLDADNRTPLHLASYYKRVELARVLLDRDAAANLKDNRGQTPLHAVADGYSRDGDVLAQLLLDHGVDVDVQDKYNQTPLHLASYFGKVKMVLLLLNAGANTGAKDAQGQTPLHLVTQCPNRNPHYFQDEVHVARLLLEHGADVNAQDKTHETPPDLASYYGRTEVASLLLRFGGKTNAKTVESPRLGHSGVQFDDEERTTVPIFEVFK